MKLRILLIESEPEEMLFLHDVLREIEETRCLPEWPRIEPLPAATWQEAEPILSASPPHVILLDLNGEEGAGVFRLVQAAAPEVPVILTVSSDDEAVAVKLIREGAEDFLFKNQIDCAPLAHALRNAVLRHRLLAAARAAALTDSLTGLCNRAGFLALAARDRKLAERLQRRWMLLIAEPKNSPEIAAAFGEQRRDLQLIEAADHLRCDRYTRRRSGPNRRTPLRHQRLRHRRRIGGAGLGAHPQQGRGAPHRTRRLHLPWPKPAQRGRHARASLGRSGSRP